MCLISQVGQGLSTLQGLCPAQVTTRALSKIITVFRSLYQLNGISGGQDLIFSGYFSFYFRATLGVKEVLQSSKNSTSILMVFDFVSLPHSKKVF